MDDAQELLLLYRKMSDDDKQHFLELARECLDNDSPPDDPGDILPD